MATKKSMCVIFGIVVISVWVLGSAILSGAETMKCKNIATAIKDERISVVDEQGHELGIQVYEGLAYFENGEIAKVRFQSVFDRIPGKATQAIGYTFYTFDDGSTIVAKFQRLVSGTGSATATTELIKGTGRFQGIKGTASATGKQFSRTKEEPARSFNDVTLTYTLPTK